MSASSLPLIDLLRNTPPPATGLRDSVRSIPPPPLCPPPLTILKIVPPPPLPSHLSNICHPPALQMPVKPMIANSSCAVTLLQKSSKNSAEANSHGSARTQDKRSANRSERLAHPTSKDGGPRDPAGGTVGRSRGSEEAREGAETPLDDAELLLVLKHLVNLFTMTSQVKAALSRVRPKAEGAGIQHQVGRLRSLVDTFREQLARRTVTLGRLIPAGTSGKPEIPRELRTKDPAGGDVSPRTETRPDVSPPETRHRRAGDTAPETRHRRAARAAICSLQALVSGDPEPVRPSCANRWGSRVKRRFLAATRPTRRVGDRLKGPHSSGPWPGPAPRSAGQPDRSPAAAARPPSSSSCSSEEERGGYFSPGCYVIDRAGLPRETANSSREAAPPADESGTKTGAGSAATAVFGIPLSVLISEAAKKKKKQQPQPTSDDCGAEVGTGAGTEAGAQAGAGAGAQAGAGAGEGVGVRRDRSWRTSCSPIPTFPEQRRPVLADREELDAVLEDIARLELRDCVPAAPAPALTAGDSGSGRQSPQSQETPRQGASASGVETTERGRGTAEEARETLSTAEEEMEEEEEEEEGGWLSTSFDEDWFLSTERDEEEQRQRAEREREEREGGAAGGRGSAAAVQSRRRMPPPSAFEP